MVRALQRDQVTGKAEARGKQLCRTKQDGCLLKGESEKETPRGLWKGLVVLSLPYLLLDEWEHTGTMFPTGALLTS